MNVFCTIITTDYFPKALILYRSISKYDPGITLYVFITGDAPPPVVPAQYPGIRLLLAPNLSEYPLVESLYRKYAHIDMNFFRWSLKPVLISYLLEKKAQKVLYVDCDMYFVNDYRFLFSELDQASVLLTPHWMNADPLTDSNSFFALFRSGIFTAGFVGASQASLAAMKWWAAACHFMMGEHPSLSIHDDQRYLDIFPAYFEGTKIIRHRGCTVGAWNYEECKRILVNGQVMINGEYPVIFIHFDEMLVTQVLKGHDPLMRPYLDGYEKAFEEAGYKLSDYLKPLDTYTGANMMLKLTWRLKLRTRIKRILYKLAQSI